MRINFILTLNFSIDPELFLLSNAHENGSSRAPLDGLETSLQNPVSWIEFEMQFIHVFFYSFFNKYLSSSCYVLNSRKEARIWVRPNMPSRNLDSNELDRHLNIQSCLEQVPLISEVWRGWESTKEGLTKNVLCTWQILALAEWMNEWLDEWMIGPFSWVLKHHRV